MTLPSGPARTLVADPPWRFGDTLGAHRGTTHGWRTPYGMARGAEAHYETMDAWDIAKFELPPLAPDCRLFLWRVAAMQVEALTVLSAWGFTAKAELVWVKMDKAGAFRLGMGRQVRNIHEVCLIGVRGRIPSLAKDQPSVFFAPPPKANGQIIHSAKPDAFFGVVERISPGPYVELFSRRERPGWTCLGNEVASLAEQKGPLFGAGFEGERA